MIELRPETIARFQQAAKNQPLFAPNAETNDSINPRTIIEFIAPAGEGKTTLTHEIERLDPTFEAITGWTTRLEEARDTDGRYTYFNTDEELNGLLDRIDAGSVVQYIQHPTTGQFYGSFPEDYHAEFNMLDVLSNTVDDLDRLAFKSIFKIAIVSHGKEWIGRFLARYPEESPERQKRIAEALQSLDWALQQPEGTLHWLHNRDGHIKDAARTAIAIVKGGQTTPDLSHLAEEMYEEALRLAA